MPGKAARDLALAIARRAVPRRLRAGARVLPPAHQPDADDAGAPHPLTELVLARHAATLRAPMPGDADVLFESDHPGEPTLVAQVRGGRVHRLLTRA
jgi:hypothetical protein